MLGASTGLDWLQHRTRIALDGIDLRAATAPFALTLTLAGSGRFAMLPIGNQSEFNVESSWPHPKFDGRFLPTEHTIDRGVKYGVLFIALTYLVVLCFELLTGARLHLVQYGVVGLALVLFYLVLLQLEDYGVVTGTAVLVAGLAALMIVTRGLHREPTVQAGGDAEQRSDAEVGEAL